MRFLQLNNVFLLSFLHLASGQGEELCAIFEEGKKVFGGPVRQLVTLNRETCASICKAEPQCSASAFFDSLNECLLYSEGPTERPDLVIIDEKAVLISFGECEVTTTTTGATTSATTTTTAVQPATTTTTGTTTKTFPPNPCGNLWDRKTTCSYLTWKGCCTTDRYWMEHFCPFSCCQFNIAMGKRSPGPGYDLFQGPVGTYLILP